MIDAATDWPSRFLLEGVRGGRRCVVVGGKADFFTFLLNSGYIVAHLDRDPKELGAIKQELVYASTVMDEFEQYCLDIEDTQDFTWLSTDILILVKALHHFADPCAFLKRMRGVLHEGSIIVADYTVELSSAERWQEWGGDSGANPECAALVERLGWRAEVDITEFMHDAGLDKAALYYALPCSCIDYSCEKITTYWYGVWPAGEWCEKALQTHALQKAVARSSFFF